MNNRNMAFVGAILLLGGLFTPIVTIPILGTLNLFSNGGNIVALSLLILALVSAGLAAKGRLKDIVWPGIAACALVIYSFGRLQYRLAQMRASLQDLQDNPFAGLAQGAMSAIQVQWGWLVLGSGAALLVFAALSKSEADENWFQKPSDNVARAAVGLSVIVLLIGPALDLVSTMHKPETASNTAAASVSADESLASASTAPTGPTAEEAAYIKQYVKLYDLKARYYDSVLDGRVPGVDFKIKNLGNRTLNEVDVRVVFYDAEGKPIAEETYYPVLESSYSSGHNPLRPNYIWQQERGQFYSAKNVPSEWKVGQVSATVTEIEFAANE